MAKPKKRTGESGAQMAPAPREAATSLIAPVPQLHRKGPYLTAALIAENVLTEIDNTITMVRVIDRVGISPEVIKDLKDNKLGFPLTIVISFKAGGFEGKSL